MYIVYACLFRTASNIVKDDCLPKELVERERIVLSLLEDNLTEFDMSKLKAESWK